MISSVFTAFSAYSAYLTQGGAGQRDFELNLRGSNMIFSMIFESLQFHEFKCIDEAGFTYV